MFLTNANRASEMKNVPVIFLILVFIYKEYEKAMAALLEENF